jgi:leucyl aminopeptidase
VTGAGYVALGASIGNLFTDSTALAGALRSASQAAGDDTAAWWLVIFSSNITNSPMQWHVSGRLTHPVYTSRYTHWDENMLHAPPGEKLWQQPIETSYFEKNVKSSIADLKNYPSGRVGGTLGGGAIIAALFLREFIADKKKLQWAHIDAAGASLLCHCCH